MSCPPKEGDTFSKRLLDRRSELSIGDNSRRTTSGPKIAYHDVLIVRRGARSAALLAVVDIRTGVGPPMPAPTGRHEQAKERDQREKELRCGHRETGYSTTRASA